MPQLFAARFTLDPAPRIPTVPCPVAAAVTLSATVSGATTLVVHDRRFRVVSATIALTLTAAWVAYFSFLRTPTARVGLEILSVAALLAGVGRVVWLVRHDGVKLPMPAALQRTTRSLLPSLASPMVIALKTWLAAMLVMEWRDKAHFGAPEYTAVSALLVAAIATSVIRARPSRPRFAALEALAAGSRVPSCPLGFGCASPATTTEPPPASFRADSRVPRGDSILDELLAENAGTGKGDLR